MNLEKFINDTNLFSKTELDKLLYLTYFYQSTANINSFSIKEVLSWFAAAHFAAPNTTRLKRNLTSSRNFVKQSGDNFKIHAKALQRLKNELSTILQNSEISDNGTILPPELYDCGSTFIKNISQQINISYENKAYDGCAVLMRRLLEVLLILSYQYLKIDQVIKDNDNNYFLLEKIVNNAKSNSILKLSRKAKSSIDVFRELGNFSAHSIFYSCKKSYIEQVIPDFRLTIEELLYKSSLKK